VTRDIEQILCRKGQTGQRPAGPAIDANARTRDKRLDIVIGHEGLGGKFASLGPAGRPTSL
jgi:hypothetical protein